jgi:hypothetical protein
VHPNLRDEAFVTNEVLEIFEVVLRIKALDPISHIPRAACHI